VETLQHKIEKAGRDQSLLAIYRILARTNGEKMTLEEQGEVAHQIQLIRAFPKYVDELLGNVRHIRSLIAESAQLDKASDVDASLKKAEAEVARVERLAAEAKAALAKAEAARAAAEQQREEIDSLKRRIAWTRQNHPKCWQAIEELSKR
jgi:hypothetical protein